jgi:hypothetical protein
MVILTQIRYPHAKAKRGLSGCQNVIAYIPGMQKLPHFVKPPDRLICLHIP